MKLKNFEKLQGIIKRSIIWEEEDIESMEQKLGKMYQNLTNIFFKEKLLTDDLQTELKKKYSEVFIDLKEKSNRAYDSKYEIETVINSNDDYYKLCLEFNKQRAILDWLEKTLDNLNNIKFEIKDYMNWKLFKSGMKF
jgi:TorA maturation chaperone TorD